MNSLYEAAQLLKKFGSADDFTGVKKLYKKGALLSHTDRDTQDDSISIVELNLAWEIICQDKDAAVSLISEIEEPCVFKSDKLHYSSLPSFYSKKTMLNTCTGWKICNSNEFKWNEITTNRQFVENCQFEYYKIYGHESFTITDIKNALKHNKTCQSITVSTSWKYKDRFNEAWFICMRDLIKSEEIQDVWQWINNLEFDEADKYGVRKTTVKIEDMELSITTENTRSNSQFSPFNLSNVKPITKAPKKWKRADLLKLLANGQFSHLSQNHHYSDGGSEVKLGYIKNPIKVFEEFLGEKNFNIWSNTGEDGITAIHFGFHSNDGRGLIVNLDNRYLSVDLEDEEKLFLNCSSKENKLRNTKH